MSSASDPSAAAAAADLIVVRDLTMAFGPKVVQRNVGFTIRRGQVFVIMGGSGCGKSTLMRHMIGLVRPAAGQILYAGIDFWAADAARRSLMTRRMGILYQNGALWSSMTLAENIGLPLGEYTALNPAQIRDVAAYKLALVGLAGFEDYYPAEISGGMRKRAGLARAMALDPEVLFFDEPSAGLDPITSKLLDDLILELKASLGATIVMVTHELPQIFATADSCVFLDAETRTQTAFGNPRDLVRSGDPKLQAFLTRGGTAPVSATPGSPG